MIGTSEQPRDTQYATYAFYSIFTNINEIYGRGWENEINKKQNVNNWSPRKPVTHMRFFFGGLSRQYIFLQKYYRNLIEKRLSKFCFPTISA